MWLYLVLTIVLAVYLLTKRTFSFWDRNMVPCIPGIFLFGGVMKVFLMKKHFAILSQEWYKKFSNLPYFGYYMGSTPVLMIRDIDIVKDVLIKEYNSFNRNDYPSDETVDPLLCTSPFMASGEKWKHYRSTLSPLFSASRIKSIFPLMELTCAKLKDYLDGHAANRADLDARDLSLKFTTENTVMCGFTLNAESFTNPDSEFLKVGHNLFEQDILFALKFLISMCCPMLDKIFAIPNLKKCVDIFFRQFITSNIASRKNAPANDLLQVLMQTKALPEIEVIGHSLSLFAEGVEASSGVLYYSMFELSRNPDIQNKLYDEICSILSESNGDLSYDALQKMIYLEAIFTETMRLYPTLVSMHKTCTVPYEFKPLPGQMHGYKMPIGGSIAIPVHAIHRDPEYYPEPDVFKPERFLPEHRHRLVKGTFLSFGEGPRMCLGMRYAQTQTKAALVTILKSFCIKLSAATKPYKIDPGNFMNAPLDPILLSFEKR